MTKALLGWLMVVLAGLFISGCETMSADECKTANWNDVGMRDGLNGKPLTMLDDRARDCAKAGARVDSAAYSAGRERGLQRFCRLENAVPLGLNGTAYAGVCPGALDHEFRRRHQVAYAVHQLRYKLNDIEGNSNRVERTLRDTDKDEDKKLKTADKEDERKRIRKEFDDRRRHLRNELRDLDRAMRHTRDDLRNAEYALDNLR